MRGRKPAPPILPEGVGEIVRAVEGELERLVAEPSESARAPLRRLREAQRHALLGGGKRMRGCLAVLCADMFAAPRSRSLRVAAAVECLHAYSLVHDDLPAMDGDDLRRGRPTVHRAYDEATAILVGDALQARAFEILSEPETHPDPGVRARLTLDLATASGEVGMVGGQALDLSPGPAAEAAVETLDRKTGSLLAYSCVAGGRVGGADDETLGRLEDFGRAFGRAYQIRDDLLDVEGDPRLVGKRLRKDRKAGKTTLVDVLGREGAKVEAERMSRKAVDAVSGFQAGAPQLRAVAEFAILRRH